METGGAKRAKGAKLFVSIALFCFRTLSSIAANAFPISFISEQL
jgi:hypothetical protein